MEGTREEYKILTRKTLGEPESIWKDNINIDVTDMCSQDMMWPEGTQDSGLAVCSRGFSAKTSHWSEMTQLVNTSTWKPTGILTA
jgi:hypothetical protein